MDSIELRGFRPLDEDFIYHSWLSSIRNEYPGSEKVTRLLIDKLLPTGECEVLVACEEEEPDHILGWLVAGEVPDAAKALHFVFVKRAFRRGGLGTALVNKVFGKDRSEKVLCSYWTFQAQQYSLKDKWRLKYNAFLLPAALNEGSSLQS